mgnify:CR=1 FL=1
MASLPSSPAVLHPPPPHPPLTVLTGGEQPDCLVDAAQGGDIHSLTTHHTSRANAGSILTGAAARGSSSSSSSSSAKTAAPTALDSCFKCLGVPRSVHLCSATAVQGLRWCPPVSIIGTVSLLLPHTLVATQHLHYHPTKATAGIV